jgi:predicted nucleic acid-binding protein
VNRVLLDTDIFSEVLKQRDPRVAAKATAYRHAFGRFTISVITVMEVTSGLHRLRAAKQLARFQAMLAGCEVLGLGLEAGLLAGKIDADLKSSGTTIDLNDAMIAAVALEAQVPVVTGNVAHYEAIRSAGYPLIIENWREA